MGCRQMAKSVVKSGLCKRALVQLSYAIGVAKPLSLFVETYGTEQGALDVVDITNIIKMEFDCRPGAIALSLALREPKYQETAAYCHFGRPEDLVPAIYFVNNKVAPDYEESELGIGDSTLISAMGECFGRSQAQIKSDLFAGDAKDLGEVALASRAAQKMLGQPPKLLIEKVFAEMKAIATAHGKDCGKLKKDKIKKM